MKYILVDLEMNPVKKIHRELRAICRQEIIEIGAVLLDDTYQEIGSFMTYVKPQYNEVVEHYITKLTGITTEQLEQAPVFEEAIRMFFDWCLSIHDEVRILEWSESDRSQIQKEMLMKNYLPTADEQRMMDCWEDFQKEYDDKLGLDRSVSLSDALMYAGIDFKGKQHDALFDSRNTAELVKILRTPALCQEALDKVVKILNPEPLGFSMGDLFDLSALIG